MRAATEADRAAAEALSRQWAAAGIPCTPRGAAGGGSTVRSSWERISMHSSSTCSSGSWPSFPQAYGARGHGDLRGGGGIGGSLLDALLAAEQAAGCRHTIVASAGLDIAGAMRFYASRGFQPWSVQMCRGA